MLIAGETLDQKVPLEVIDALIHSAELDGESSFFIGQSKRI